MGDFDSKLFRRLAEAEESTMMRGGTLEDTWTPAQLRSIEQFQKLIWKVLMLRAEQMMVKDQEDRKDEHLRVAKTNIELTFVSYSAARKDGDTSTGHEKMDPSKVLPDSRFPIRFLTENVRVGVKFSEYDFRREGQQELPQESLWWCAQIMIRPLVCPNPK